MKTEELQQWIKQTLYYPNPNKLNIKRIQKNAEWINKHYPEYYDSILQQTSFLTEPLFKERIYCILHNITKPVLCKNCNTNPVNFHKKCYYDFCSHKCAMSAKQTLDKKKVTKEERYGDPNYNNREKMGETCEREYGYKHHWMSPVVQQKRKERWIENHGVDNPSKLDWVQEEKNNTCLKNHGVEHPYQSEEIKQRGTNTNLIIRGVENPFQCKIVKQTGRDTKREKYGDPNYTNREKSKETCLEKYNVEHPQQSGTINPTGQGYKNSWHKHILPSGKEIKLQGYEPRAMDELLKQYNEDEILYKRTDMPEFWYYTLDNKIHRYYPDFYMPKDNLIVEVKSTYTYKADLEINLLKEESVKDVGYEYKLVIYD